MNGSTKLIPDQPSTSTGPLPYTSVSAITPLGLINCKAAPESDKYTLPFIAVLMSMRVPLSKSDNELVSLVRIMAELAGMLREINPASKTEYEEEVCRRDQPFNVATSSPTLEISINSLLSANSADPSLINRVNLRSSTLAIWLGSGSGCPGVGHNVCTQSSLAFSPCISV